jgi:hypothetical protein
MIVCDDLEAIATSLIEELELHNSRPLDSDDQIGGLDEVINAWIQRTHSELLQRFSLPVQLRDKQCPREVLQRRRRATRRALRDVVRQLKGYKESRNANNASRSD